MKICVSIILMMMLANQLSAQFMNKYLFDYKNSFRPGTLTLKSGQVLDGEIKFYLTPDKLLFKSSPIQGRQEYTSEEVESFSFDDKSFKSIENFYTNTPIIDLSKYPRGFQESAFVETLVEGEINLYLYAFKEKNPMGGFVPLGANQINSVNRTNVQLAFLLSKTSENESYFTYVPIESKWEFKEQLSEYFSRNNELSIQIANGDFKRPQIKDIVERYNSQADSINTKQPILTEIKVFRKKTGEVKIPIIVTVNENLKYELNRNEVKTIELTDYLNEICVGSDCISIEADGSSLHLMQCGNSKKTGKAYVRSGHITNARTTIEYIE